MGGKGLFEYFLKGNSTKETSPSLIWGSWGRESCIVLNTELSGPLEQRTRISQEKLGNSSS